MRLQRRQLLAFALLLSLLSLAPKCSKSNTVREAAKASDRMATLIGSMIDVKRDLAATGQITADEELALTQHLLTANTRVKQFNEFARRQTDDSPETRLNLAESFNQVIEAVNKLSNEAIFPVKNAESKKRLLAILNSINASVMVIDAALRS